MSITSISSASANPPPPVDTFRQSFGKLVNALQAGNLSAAQDAYSALTQSGSGDSSGPFAQALSQIGDALQSGDVAGAQKALASLQQQMQAAKGAHHHHGGHHHDNDGDKSSSATSSASSNATDPTATQSTNLVDVTA